LVEESLKATIQAEDIGMGYGAIKNLNKSAFLPIILTN
jgi:hypothetical protein